MNFKKPEFWDKSELSIWSIILYPFSLLFLIISLGAKFLKIRKKFPIPIVCVGNIYTGGKSLTVWVSEWLDPFGQAIGLDGVILLAYIIAIPANEIVVPTIIMAYTGAGMMIELETMAELKELLVGQQGWTLLTAVCLMLFSLLHNPCSTTMWTVYKETKSIKWTVVSGIMPLAIGFVLLFIIAQTAYWIMDMPGL